MSTFAIVMIALTIAGVSESYFRRCNRDEKSRARIDALEKKLDELQNKIEAQRF
ncbi:MAG: hypothetical protein PHX13_10390 [Thiovulaceae bacterium]|nr:hypothetical protein [Sulfurimonadaceae bacterium]